MPLIDAAAAAAAAAAAMDLQTRLKAILKNKYRHLNPILPINVATLSNEELFNPKQPLWYTDRSHVEGDGCCPPFPFEDLFKCSCEHEKSQRTIFTVGPCGIGKTTAVQVFALDWAENRAHTHIDLLFPISCMELKLLQHKQFSLIQLLHLFFPDLKELSFQSLNGKNIWFVFDELQEMVSSLTEVWFAQKVSDVKFNQVTFTASLLVSLMKGLLLPNAHIWVTTRYYTMDLIPEAHILKKTEMLGFSDEQKKRYIRKLVGNETLFYRIMDHIVISRSLLELCRIPHMCTVMATVLKKHVTLNDFKVSFMTLTQIFSSLIHEADTNIIQKLIRFAFTYNHTDYTWINGKCLTGDISKLNVHEASDVAKKHPLVFKEEKSMFGHSMFRFTHVYVLEYLTALEKLAKEVIKHPPKQHSTAFLQMIKETERYYECRHFEFFFQFFFGFLKERGVLQLSDPFFVSIKKQILCGFEYNYKTVNRYRWLREFDSRALADEVDAIIDPLRHRPLSGLRCNQLSGVYKMTAALEGLRLNIQTGLIRSDETMPKCVPLLLKLGIIMLRFSNLSSVCCPVLAFVLSCKESQVKEMDLGFNSITDPGMKILAPGLSHQDCRLRILRLPACELTASACEYLGTALTRLITLKELDLSCNSIGDVGMQHLSTGLESPMCLLEILKLSQCNIKRKGVFHLASALQKNPGVFQWLDLSMNKIGNKAANELFTKFDIATLFTLDLYCCGLSAPSCAMLASALQDDESNLVSLNLSSNNLKDEGVQFICGGLFAGSRLQHLNLSRCGLAKVSCLYVSKVLSSVTTMFSEDKQMFWQTSELKGINLSRNRLTDDGGVFLSAGLGNPMSVLERLDLTECFLSSGCCLELANQLSCSECHVQELDLTNNCIQDRGLKQLCAALKSPQCALKKLVLRNCGLTSKCVPFLNTALKTNVNLKELYLLGNRLDDTAKKVLVGMAKNNFYKLETIDVEVD